MRRAFCLFLILASAAFAASDAEEPTISLAFDAVNGSCTVTIRNTLPEPLTILDAFNKAGGMSWDFPLGTEVRGKDTGWIWAYMRSSHMNDHGPSYMTNRETGKVSPVDRPQKNVLLPPGASLVRTFSIRDLRKEIFFHRKSPPEGPFRIKISVFVAIDEARYRRVTTESDWLDGASFPF